jgi:hypothetical protein
VTRGISAKVEHVRAARRAGVTGAHTCHWPGCTQKVPPAVWGCQQHWYALPSGIRARIWAAYRPGQEVTKRPTAEYLVAAKEAQEWIAEHPDAGKALSKCCPAQGLLSL